MGGTFLKNGWRFLYANKLPLMLIAVSFLMTIAFLVFFYAPPATWLGSKQPIAFSHRVHAGVKRIDCRFCHPYVNRSLHPGLPAVEKCLFCHQYIIANHPEIQKEHWYFNTGTPTPWVKVNYLPEHVLFNHERHIRKEIDCQQCHGRIETLDRLPNNRFKMGFCLTCHREKKVNLDCWLACHG
jgi:hypothetical protein